MLNSEGQPHSQPLQPDWDSEPRCAAHGYGLAIDIGGTKTTVALVELPSGQIRDLFTVPTPASDTQPEAAAVELTTYVAQARAKAREHAISFCAIVRPGALTGGSSVVMSPNTPALADDQLAEALTGVVGDIPLLFENDVRAAALAELTEGRLQDAEPGLYVNLGTGVAATLVANGRIVRGARDGGGEIGYMTTQSGLLGAPNVSRDIAPLEQLIGGEAILAHAEALLGRRVEAAELFQSDDPHVRSIVVAMATHLAAALHNLCTLVCPQRIVFGGGMVRSFDAWGPLVGAFLARSLVFPPELVTSSFGPSGSIRGAALLILDAFQRGVTAQTESLYIGGEL